MVKCWQVYGPRQIFPPGNSIHQLPHKNPTAGGVWYPNIQISLAVIIDGENIPVILHWTIVAKESPFSRQLLVRERKAKRWKWFWAESKNYPELLIDTYQRDCKRHHFVNLNWVSVLKLGLSLKHDSIVELFHPEQLLVLCTKKSLTVKEKYLVSPKLRIWWRESITRINRNCWKNNTIEKETQLRNNLKNQ